MKKTRHKFTILLSVCLVSGVIYFVSIEQILRIDTTLNSENESVNISESKANIIDWRSKISRIFEKIQDAKHNINSNDAFVENITISAVTSVAVTERKTTAQQSEDNNSQQTTQQLNKFSEIELAYASDPGLELTFFETEIETNADSIEAQKLHQDMLDEQVTALDEQINTLHLDAVEAADPEVRLTSIAKIAESYSDQATFALIDIAKNTFDENRHFVVKTLSDRVMDNYNHRGALLAALSNSLENADVAISDMVQRALIFVAENESLVVPDSEANLVSDLSDAVN